MPYGNGEDIFFSFIVSIYYSNKHYCNTGINAKELPQGDVAVGSKHGHLDYRRLLCKYLYENQDTFKAFISNLKLP